MRNMIWRGKMIQKDVAVEELDVALNNSPPSLVSPAAIAVSQIFAVLKLEKAHELDLEKIATKANSTYDPENCPAVKMSLEQSGVTAWIFESWILLSEGAESERNAHLAAMEFMGEMQRMGFRVRVNHHETFFCALYELPFPLHFGNLEPNYNPDHRCGPENDPGLVYDTTVPGTTLFVLASGQIVIKGANSWSVREANILHPQSLGYAG
ncbi:hypothetical protein MHYP_G00141910 [Metynnis hypsauchen]